MGLKNYLQSKLRLYQAWQWLKANKAPVIAAYCLFHLNRHARGIQRGKTKTTIYLLKSALIRWLYQNGYCVNITRSIQTLACWHTWDYNNGWEDYCTRCDNTGIYRENILYKFVFEVEGKIYIWHQPERLIDWPIPDYEHQWPDELPEYNPFNSEQRWLDKDIKLLYIYAVWLFLKQQGAIVDIELPRLKWALWQELLCQRCHGEGYTASHHIHRYGYNICYKCATMGYRLKWMNLFAFYYKRIYQPNILPSDLLDLSVPFWVKWLEGRKQQKREIVQYELTEDEIPF